MTRTPELDSPSLEVDFGGIDLHPGQIEVLNHPARFKLLRAGRRWRKTSIGIVQAFTGYQGNKRKFRGALDGGHIGWWVPSLTGRYVVGDWIPIRSIAAQVPGTRIEEANHRVVLPSGGSIMVLTGDNVDSGRGLGLDGAVLEEAALQNQLLWSATIRATLIDRKGWALFLFTPTGENWIWQLEQDLPNLGPEWHAFHYRSADNPTLDRAELESLTGEMSTLMQLQEIEAEYVSAGAGMFHPEWFRHYFTRLEGEELYYMLGEGHQVPDAECKKFHTVDLAWSLEEGADYTVISTWAVTPHNHLLLLGVDRGHYEGPEIIPHLKRVYERYGGVIWLEKAAKGLSIIQEANRAGLPIQPLKADKDKVTRAWPATARMEQGQIWFPPASVPWYRQIEEEMLSFPAGRHDDFVDTLSYAAQLVARSGGRYLAKLA